MASKKIRIAVCLYGQLRTAEYCAPYIKEMFSRLAVTELHSWKRSLEANSHDSFKGKQEVIVDVDYFMCIKDKNYSNSGSDYTEGSNLDVDKIISAYKPKRYTIVDDRVDKILVKFERPDGSLMRRNTWASMFAGMNEANNLKKLYEAENGFTYDFCMMHRFDTLLGPDINLLKKRFESAGVRPFEVVVSVEPHHWKHENYRLASDDLLLLSDGLTMDLLLAECAKTYTTDDLFINTDEIQGPNVVLYRAASNCSIKLVRDFMFMAVVRQDADLTVPVLESWSYHQQFWVTNHKVNKQG